ncbi:hypothetical protein Tco_0584755, partial [Tanacetum coccineum]
SAMKKARDSSFAVPSDQNPTTAGKTPAALEKLVIQSGQQDIGSGLAAVAMEDFVSSSVTPTPEHEYEDELGDNVRTCLASAAMLL